MSILCCKRNKVEDQDQAIAINPTKDLVFIFVSSNVISKGLLGTLIQFFEKKSLKTVQIEMKAGDPSKFPKSPLFKTLFKHENFSPLGLYMLWTGENIYQRSSEVVHRFGNMHSISKVDIIYTHSAQETKKEMDLWFEKDPILAKNVEAVPTAPAAEAEVPVEVAEIPQAELPPEPAHPEEPSPTYEDAATAEVPAAEEQK